MRTAFALVLLGVAVATAIELENKLSFDMVDKINSNPKSTWKAGYNKVWDGKPMKNIKRNFGWIKKEGSVTKKDISVAQSLPTNFDSRSQWPQCSTARTIYNQAECGSCWAFGAVEAISDRFCIHLQKNVLLSFQEMVTCNNQADGCEGGDAGIAWNYCRDNGLVSSQCSPYTVPTCPPAQQPCLNFVNTPACVQKCEANSTLNWSQDQHYLSSVYGVNSDQNQIMSEIFKNGPVEACFEVYEDFLHYKSGVYQHTTGSDLGGHCVKMLGWGVENGTPYWLCANSWTTYWGNKGYFKILRGSDECGIEDDVVAGIPSMTPPSTSSTSSSSSSSGSAHNRMF
jgi:cathepsin B